MAGAETKFNSNFDLGLAASVQGIYNGAGGGYEGDDSEIDKHNDHRSATLSLSQILSDALTFKARVDPLGAAVTAWKLVDFSNVVQTDPNAVLIQFATGSSIFVGFVQDDARPGDFVTVFRAGIIKEQVGIIPGTKYYNAGGGGLTTSNVGPIVGVGISSTEVMVLLTGLGY